MIKNEILSKKSENIENMKILDFFERSLFCRFCDKKVAVSRHIIDQFQFQDQIWKVQ
jgi:hypothetical protein